MSINDEEQLCDMIELQDKIVGDFTATAMPLMVLGALS